MIKSILIALIVLIYLSFLQDKDDVKVEKAFDTLVNDSIPIQIDLYYNEKNLPEHYVSHVETPVCKDGLCYLMVIDIYWDLLGNFLKYELPEEHPLTKFDHVEFTGEDHEKMREILSNKDSFLRFYALDNLIDPNEQMKSNVVDGVSGATHKSIQSEVVSGAVFSTYVLWHIVNGPIAPRILEHTENRFTDALMVQLLTSDNYHYQYYALNKLAEEDIHRHLSYIIRLISDGIAYVPYFAIEKIPVEAWEAPETQLQIISLLDKLDFEMKNEILNRISNLSLTSDACDVLVADLHDFNENQLIKGLGILKQNSNAISTESMSKISTFTGHANKEVSALSADIVKE